MRSGGGVLGRRGREDKVAERCLGGRSKLKMLESVPIGNLTR